MRYIFLDIDGVLNDHAKHVNGYCGIKSSCVEILNCILYATDAKLIISSAWRYLVHNGSMTLTGFENLLLSHGVNCYQKVHGVTRKDVSVEVCDRGEQIAEYVREHNIEKYVVLDDLDLGISRAGHPFCRTNGRTGLVDDNYYHVMELLK